jgi:hypothetical protein
MVKHSITLLYTFLQSLSNCQQLRVTDASEITKNTHKTHPDDGHRKGRNMLVKNNK